MCKTKHKLHKVCQITQRASNYYTVKCQFFGFNLKKITPGKFFYTSTAGGACDKYEVCDNDDNDDDNYYNNDDNDNDNDNNEENY